MSTTESAPSLSALLTTLGHRDRPGAVWCALLMAERTLPVVPPRAQASAERTLALCRIWAQGEAVEDWTGTLPGDRAELKEIGNPFTPGFLALQAIVALKLCAKIRVDPGVARSSLVEDLVRVPMDVSAALGSPRQVLPELWDVFEAQQCPASPEGLSVQTASSRVAVAWDYVSERVSAPIRVGTLGEALARARLWALDWSNPVERAIAERAPLAPGVEQLLRDVPTARDTP